MFFIVCLCVFVENENENERTAPCKEPKFPCLVFKGNYTVQDAMQQCKLKEVKCTKKFLQQSWERRKRLPEQN